MGLRLQIPRISQDVSTAQEDVRQAGQVGRAMSSLGQSISSVGQTVGRIASIQERRAEQKRKTEVNLRKKMYEAKLRAEHESIKQEFKNDPDRGLKAYSKRKEKLSQDLVAGLEDAETLKRLNYEKSIIDTTYDSRAESYKNLRNVEIAKDTHVEVANIEAVDFRETPRPKDEIYGRLHGQKLSIDSSDIREEEKTKLWLKTQKTMVMGAINGYMSANNLKGFAKAEQLIENINTETKKDANGNVVYDNTRLMIKDKDKYLAIIRNRRLQYINEKANRDRNNKKLIQQQFEREILPIREAVNMKIADPNANISADYRKLVSMGVVSGPNKAMSRDQMDQHKVYRSRVKLMGLLEGMSETTNKFSKRKQVYKAYFDGLLAAEDADIALNALETDLIKSYGRYQAKESDRILKRKASSGTSIFGSDIIDPELYIKFATMRDNLVRDKGIPPITAARMIIRKEGNSVLQQDARRALRVNDPELRVPTIENIEIAKKKLAEEFIKSKGDAKKVRSLERQFKRVKELEEDVKNDQIDPTFMKIMDEVTGVKSE